MGMRRLRAAAGAAFVAIALLLAGCHSAQPPGDPEVKEGSSAPDRTDEAHRVAEASLGKQAEVLAHGDLAGNGREQVLVIDRFSPQLEVFSPSPILVTRAAVLEKNGGKWSQILLCDEHLKNPNGYLGGSLAAHASGWRLEFKQDATQGLEMRFTPAEESGAGTGNAEQGSERTLPSFDVRWNKNTKRYQSYDQSHERYLSEIPSLETPESVLK